MEHIRPHFDRPPLVEQAIVAVFDPIANFSIVDYGLFWAEIRDQYPDVSSSDPLVEHTENFDQVRAPHHGLELLQALPLPRAMFRDATGGELVHVQPNQFGFNWSKVGDAHYPRSEQVMARFDALFARFAAFVEVRGLGPLSLKQGELTNLNIIPVAEFGAGYDDMTRAFNVDPLDLGVQFLKAETFNRARQHRITDKSGASLGRLHTVISPVVSTQDGKKAFRLELTARSRPGLATLDDIRGFFAVARDAINGAFCATVSEEMKDRWGERRA